MKYFDSEEYCKLETVIRSRLAHGDDDASEDLACLKKASICFAEYVFRVCEERIETRFAQGVLKEEQYRNLVYHFDSSRHNSHEKAIVNARMINRIAETYGIGDIFLGNPTNRREIGNFCGEITGWIFNSRYN